MQYQVLTAYHNGNLQETWQSLKAELVQADHFNNSEELPFNEAQQDRLGEIAAAILVVIADDEIRRLENDIHNVAEKQQDGVNIVLSSENEALYDFWQSPEYNLKRALQDMSGTRTMITDTYNVRDVIEA